MIEDKNILDRVLDEIIEYTKLNGHPPKKLAIHIVTVNAIRNLLNLPHNAKLKTICGIPFTSALPADSEIPTIDFIRKP
jgi:hypothetical protein